MPKTLDPFRLLLIAVAGWMSHEQQQVIDYLREENRVLRAQTAPADYSSMTISGVDWQSKSLGKRVLTEVATIVPPETLLRWHRKLIAETYDGSAKRAPGRPGTARALTTLIVRMATENRDWGYRRIQGALSNLRHTVSRGTIANILKKHGIEPAPKRSRNTTWKEFLARHWELIVAANFFTVEVWTRRGLQRFLVLFFIELSTRRIKIAGIGAQANGLWMSQIARELSDPSDGLLIGKRYLIHDRDPLFTAEFQNMLAEVGIESVKLPPRSPNLNAYAERFVRTIKESCLDRLMLFGEGSLRKVIREFVAHYHQERNHQGLGNRLIILETNPAECHGTIQRRQRLGGMLNYYHRAA